MAVETKYLDNRVLVNGNTSSLLKQNNFTNLNEFIQQVVDDATTDFTSINVDTVNESTAAHGVIVDGVILKDTTVDVNGTADAIILDTDGDTTISAPTDDQIDVEINGADDFTFTANTFTALSGSSIATNTIGETTTAAGVTVDGVLCKDSSVALADGTVGNLSVKIGADANNGLYGVSDTQLGVAVEGALVGFFDQNGLNTSYINEQVTTAGVYLEGVHFRDGVFNTYPNFGVAKDVTGSVSANELSTGYITSTSAAPVTLSFPTATDLYTRLNACPGSMFEVVVDNSAGSDTVTISLDASMAVVTPVITGGDSLTISTANAVGIFKIVFTSSTTAKIFRIA